MTPQQPLWREQLNLISRTHREAAHDALEQRLVEADLELPELTLARLAIGHYSYESPTGELEPGTPMDIRAAAKLGGLELRRQSIARVQAVLSHVVAETVYIYGKQPKKRPSKPVLDSIGTYFRNPEFEYDLLTREEEQALFSRIALGRTLDDEPSPSPEQKVILQDAKAARDTLVVYNLKFAASIAKRYVRKAEPGRSYEDLIQVANEALIHAAEDVKPRKDAKFASYAGVCIRGKLNSYIAKGASQINLKDDHFPTVRFLREEADLAQKLGHYPTVEELVAHDATKELDEEQIKKYRTYAALMIVKTMSDNELWLVPSEELDPDILYRAPARGTRHAIPEDEIPDTAIHGLLRRDLEKALDTLEEREAGLIAMRFGIDQPGEKMHTLDEIAKVYGVSRERIRQIESKAMSKLRHPARSKQLEGYLD